LAGEFLLHARAHGLELLLDLGGDAQGQLRVGVQQQGCLEAGPSLFAPAHVRVEDALIERHDDILLNSTGQLPGAAELRESVLVLEALVQADRGYEVTVEVLRLLHARGAHLR
jgi:hypothetical protein